MNFDIAFERLIGHEGGFSNDPRDPGNWTGGRQGVGVLKGTKFGIAANTYPDIDIENLTLLEAKEIYYRDWWMNINADQMDPVLVYQVWDFAVNAGMSSSKRALQRAVRVAEDGQIGPMTVRAVRAMGTSDVLLRFNAQRIRYYTSLSKWPTYGKGWANRVAANLDFGADDDNLSVSTT